MNDHNCIPSYWKKLPQSLKLKQQHPLDCSTSKQYGTIFDLTIKPKQIKHKQSCTMMTIMVNTEEYYENSTEIPLYFKYATDVYEEVQNSKAFNIEALLGHVGGIVGMFLGFSVLQLLSILLFAPR